MAGIVSKRNMGQYPLNQEWRKFLWRLWKPFDPGKGNKRALILDPFANTGETVLEMAQNLNMEPYAVELDDNLIAQGRLNFQQFYTERGMADYSLSRYIHGNSFDVEMSNGAFSIVYLNPPYDDLLIVDRERHVADGGMYRSQRYELTALQHYFKYVAPNGFLVWVAYSHHMSRQVIREFRKNCDKISVFRFPDPHLDKYTQVCVIGQYLKGHSKNQDPVHAAKVEDWFLSLSDTPEQITDIEKAYNHFTKKGTFFFQDALPPLNITRGIVYFRAKEVKKETLLAIVEKSGAQHMKAFKALTAMPQDEPIDQPLHSPNKRQVVANIASGMLDGLLLHRNGKKCMLRGSVQEFHDLVDRQEELVEQEKETIKRIKETTIIRPDHHIVLLYEDGTIEDVSGADALSELVSQNSTLLIETFQERYHPFYDLHVHPTWEKLLSQIQPGGIGNFFRPQVYVIVCTIEHLAIRNRQITNAQQGFGKTPTTGAAIIGLRLLDAALRYKGGEELPEIAVRFNMTAEDLYSLTDSICQRYNVSPSDLVGLPTEKPALVTVPPIAPSVWMEQEIAPLYEGFKYERIYTASDADRFMAKALSNTDSSVIYLGVLSYEQAKAGEGVEPAARAKYSRTKSWVRSDQGDKTIVHVTKRATDPVTGGIIHDGQGDEVPWIRFTPEKRGKELYFYRGPVFYGYKQEIVTLADGKKELQRTNTKLYSNVIIGKLTRDMKEENNRAGYPKYISRQYPLFTEIRRFGFPKVGNGFAITPFKEKKIPPREITVVRYVIDGVKLAQPRLETIWTKGGSYLVPDFEHQQALIKDEPIIDPWLASMGTRFISESGRRDSLDRLMKKHGYSYYRVGDGNKAIDAELNKKGLQSYKTGVGQVAIRNPRYPVSKYIRRFYDGSIGIFIADELHMAKSNTTEISAAFRDFVSASSLTLGLTGTLFGGNSSSVYSLAYAFDEYVRKKYRWTRGAPMKWVEDMGVRKMVEVRDVGQYSNAIRSGGKRGRVTISEAPGASPRLMRLLAKYTLWASLLDLRGKMPNKQEVAREIEFDKQQAAIYDYVYKALRDYNGKLLITGDKSFLAAFYTGMLFLPDSMHRDNVFIHNIVTDKGAARRKAADPKPVIVLQTPGLGDKIRPKEAAVIETLKADIADGRNVIIALCQTQTRDIQPRWEKLIRENVPNAKPFILTSSVSSDKRSAHIKKKFKDEGYNVMITNAGLITTAISLTYVSAWYTIEYEQSLYKFSQATARINRPNAERRDIKYEHFYYADKFQRQAVMNIADKVKAAAVLAGAEGGDLSAMMGSDERVASYEMLLKAIEEGRIKEKSAEQINEAFSVGAYNEGNWSDSAWYKPGDEEYENGVFYAETEVETSDDSEDESSSNLLDDEL